MSVLYNTHVYRGVAFSYLSRESGFEHHILIAEGMSVHLLTHVGIGCFLISNDFRDSYLYQCYHIVMDGFMLQH